jgi:ArsR family transcriptional regulator
MHIPSNEYASCCMTLVQIYQCLCDQTRLRILNLLARGPLCVCHLQEVLNEEQVKISKHLAYLREHGMVDATREANWMIYRVPEKASRELEANLACLQDCVADDPMFRRDVEKLERMRDKFEQSSPICCSPKKSKKTASSR